MIIFAVDTVGLPELCGLPLHCPSGAGQTCRCTQVYESLPALMRAWICTYQRISGLLMPLELGMGRTQDAGCGAPLSAQAV